MCKILIKDVDFWRTDIVPWPRLFGLYSKTMWNKQRYCRQLQNLVWIQNVRRNNWKITMLGKSSYLFVVLRYGRSCTEWRGKILRTCKQNNATIIQSRNTMHWLSPIQRRRNGIYWRIVKVLEDLIFDGQWTNLHDRLRNGPKPVTNAWIDWFHICITHVNTNNIVMWVILLNNADWDCFKILTSREILKIQNPLQGEHYVFSAVIHMFQ